MDEFLTRTERQISDGMGGFITYYNNLYFTPGNAILLGFTEDGMYDRWSWQAVEIDPRTGLSRTYSDSTLIETGPNAGQSLGIIDDSLGFRDGLFAKVGLIVPLSPGAEVTV